MFDEENFNNTNEQNAVTVEPINSYIPLPKSYLQKKDIRRLAMIIGIPALVLNIIGSYWYDLYLFLTIKVLGISEISAQKFLFDPAAQQIFMQILPSCVMFLIPFTIAAKLGGFRIDSLVRFNKTKRGTFLPFVLFGVGFCAFANVATAYVSAFFRETVGEQYSVPDRQNPEGIFGFAISFIAIAIVPALVEEFACRGIILGLLRKHGEGFAIITSSIVFGVMHGNFEQIPFATFAGLIFGYIYVKTNSIWPSVLVHGINNAVSVSFGYLNGIIDSNTQGIIYTAYLAVAMIFAIIGILIYSKKTGDNYSLQRSDTAVTETQKYLCFFTSLAILLFLASNFYEAFSFFKR